tara:strand:+ start:550 stop:888 length:339 start_codon:yes stop_codon:yes gene_type:complete
MDANQKYLLYFMSIVVLVIILYIVGYNIMSAYEKKKEIMNNSEINHNNNEIIHKKIKLEKEINKIIKDDYNSNVGVIRVDNWEEKVKNHMKYQHGNPMMYNERVKVLYDDLQ